MLDNGQVLRTAGADAPDADTPMQPCVMLVFGASGDLTKRLLVPALYNLACDGLLSENFALLGSAMDPLTTESFRERMTADIKKFHTRKEFDAQVWEALVGRFHYAQGAFNDKAVFEKLRAEVKRSTASPARTTTSSSTLRRRRGSSACSATTCTRPASRRDGLEAHHRREALRHRPAVGAASSTAKSSPTGTRTRSTASTTTSGKRPSRTCSRSGSRTGCSSRSGTRTTSTTSSSTSPRPSTSKGAVATTTRPASCAT